MYLTRIAGIEPIAGPTLVGPGHPMYLTRIAGIEPNNIPIVICKYFGCILPAQRELKPLQARLDHQLLMMYLTRIAGIETILQCVVQLYGYKMYLTRIAGIETQKL